MQQIQARSTMDDITTERVARAICAERWSGNDGAWSLYEGQARTVIAIVRQTLQAEIMERCASECDRLEHELQDSKAGVSEARLIASVNESIGAQKCAKAIRALVSPGQAPGAGAA